MNRATRRAANATRDKSDHREGKHKRKLGPGGIWARAVPIAAVLGPIVAAVAADQWETLERGLWIWGLALSPVLYVLLVGLAHRRVRGTSHARRIRPIAGFAVPLAAFWSMAGAYAANAVLDPTLRERKVKIVQKREVRTSKGTRLYVYFAPWPPLTEEVFVTVQRPAFSRLPQQGTVRALVGDGRLGFPWIKSVERLR